MTQKNTQLYNSINLNNYRKISTISHTRT